MADTPGPTVIDADHVDGIGDREARAEGHVVMQRDNETVEAEWVKLFQPMSEITAGDHTRMTQKGDVFDGGELNLRDDVRIGSLESPRYSMAPRPPKHVDPFAPAERTMKHGGHGDAVRLLFEGPDKYRLEQARFTTCAPDNEEWFIRSKEMELDYTRNLGIVRSGVIEFKDVPIIPAPYLDFSLDGSRKSGFLPPTYGAGGHGGLDLTVPWYWNIAPNYDATLSPRFISKRGLLMGSEFRYLEPGMSGQIKVEDISHDNLYSGSRHSYGFQHHQDIAPGWHADFDVQSVSDDRYFADFGDRIAVASTTYLPRNAILTYSQPGFTGTLAMLRTQTIQDPTNPVAITVPYSREPQLSFNYNPVDASGYHFETTGEAVSFRHPTEIEGKRYTTYPSISWPIENAWGFITPKIGFSATRYQLNDGRTIDRNLPITSLDSGLYFDRDTRFMGQDLVQSLEPRLYYVRIPYRDQSAIPNFDTARADFSFAQIFSENQFVGGDRINNANQITAAVTSRLSDANSGIERARLTIGQRYYLESQKVGLPGETLSDSRSSDLLTALSVQPSKDWWVDSGWDYNESTGSTAKATLELRYQPTVGKVLNLAYRLDKISNSKQIDISTEWPITARWHGVFRHNWSILDHRALETLAGLEYNAGCWAFRVVSQRFVTSSTTYSTPIFFQLELNDFSSIGTNPLQVLKDSIPGYSKLN